MRRRLFINVHLYNIYIYRVCVIDSIKINYFKILNIIYIYIYKEYIFIFKIKKLYKNKYLISKVYIYFIYLKIILKNLRVFGRLF